MRKPIIAGNWKMNKTRKEALDFVQALEGKVSANGAEAVLCAPFIHLPDLVKWAQGKPVHIAAQTMHFEENGAFTGEVSPSMLQDLGVTYVIIGHSERRQYFNETDETVNLKAIAAYKNGLRPIICVGEHLEEREEKQTKQVVEAQVIKALTNVKPEQVLETVIAYEPIWAIGTGKTATAEDANDVIAYIRQTVAKLYDQHVADKLRIQYGGSVKPGNIAELMQQPDVDGALVGGASLKAEDYLQLLEGSQT